VHASTGTVTASDLLAPAPAGGDPLIPAGLLDDLHDPTLIITDGYVGPDPRARAGHRPSAPPARRPRVRPVVVAVVLTAAVVAPLTLAFSHPVGPAPVARPALPPSTAPLGGR
jgi:hypothetical protein